MTKTVRWSQVLTLFFIMATATSGFSIAAASAESTSSKNPIPGKDAEACRLENRPHAVVVKFKDGLKIRLRKGELIDLDGRVLSSRVAKEVLAKLEGGVWIRNHLVDEATLDRLRLMATRRSDVGAPDLNLYFTLGLPERICISDAIELLSLLREVDFVYPFPKYELALDFYGAARGFHEVEGEQYEKAWQKYLSNEADGGIEALYAHSRPGGRGDSVNLLDVEGAFEPGHYELKGIIHDFGEDAFAGVDQRHIDHGTATLGVVGADEYRPGIVGIASRTEKYFAPTFAFYHPDYVLPSLVYSYCQQIPLHSYCANVEGVLMYELAGGALRQGDVVLLELQMAGPNSPTDYGFENQFGSVPVEWNPAVFDAIRTLSLLGIVVVQAGGNGSQNLDDPIYRAGDHRPFLVENGLRVNDSGAIIVGAVSSGTDWATGRVFLPGGVSLLAPSGIPRRFSNIGQRIDSHAWGDGVVTSGYGDLYGDDVALMAYTANYGGTSSASAIVAGAAASIQGVYKHLAESTATGGYGFRSTLWGSTLRSLLNRTGTDKAHLNVEDQQALSQSPLFNVDPDVSIGTRPNLRRAIESLDVQDEDFCAGQSVPPPALSAESGPVIVSNGIFRVGLNYGGDPPYGPNAGVFDIIFTLDGTEPDCIPRLGNCDLSRVYAITQPMIWRFDPGLTFQASALPLTIRAKTAAVWPSCGSRFSEETSATYVIN